MPTLTTRRSLIFFVDIASWVTPFKFALPLASVVVGLLGLFLVFTSLNCLEIRYHRLDHFDLRLGRLNFCLDWSRPTGFRLDWLRSGSAWTDRLSTESVPAWFNFRSRRNSGQIVFCPDRLPTLLSIDTIFRHGFVLCILNATFHLSGLKLAHGHNCQSL